MYYSMCITHVVINGFWGVAGVVGLVGAGRRVSRIRSVVVGWCLFITMMKVTSRCAAVVVTDRSGCSAVVSGSTVSQVASASYVQQESSECALPNRYKYISMLFIRKKNVVFLFFSSLFFSHRSYYIYAGVYHKASWRYHNACIIFRLL